MDQHFLDVITRLGYQDGQCNKIVFGEAVKELTKPGERMMYDMLREMLSKVRYCPRPSPTPLRGVT